MAPVCAVSRTVWREYPGVLALATLLPAVRKAVYAAFSALVPMEKMPLMRARP